jgi:hypothetical protein
MSVYETDADGKMKIMNPKTKRYIIVGSDRHKKLVKKGVFPEYVESDNILVTNIEQDVESESDTPLPPPPMPKSPPLSPPPSPKVIRTKIKSVIVEVAKKNKSKLKELSQNEADEMLKRLIYKRLMGEPTVVKKSKKKSKKSKYVVESSSDESESDSD